MVEEDENTCHCFSLLKYFLAEGDAVRNECAFVSGQERPSEFLKTLPKNLTLEYDLEKQQMAQQQTQQHQVSQQQTTQQPQSVDKMTIAWQYEKYLKQSSQPGAVSGMNKSGFLALPSISSTHFCHSYDLSKPSERIHKIAAIDILEMQPLCEPGKFYQTLYSQLKSLLEPYQKKNERPRTNVLRLAIQSFASPVWFQSEKDVSY